jgi:hypothetical protein
MGQGEDSVLEEMAMKRWSPKDSHKPCAMYCHALPLRGPILVTRENLGELLERGMALGDLVVNFLTYFWGFLGLFHGFIVFSLRGFLGFIYIYTVCIYIYNT